VGYARVSTAEQSADGQLDALRAAGVERVWTDVGSGARADRPALAEMLAADAAGDTVVVTRLDRLGRSLPDLLRLVENLATRDVGLRSLAEQIDTTSATGRLVLHVFAALVFAALAEFERAPWLGRPPPLQLDVAQLAALTCCADGAGGVRNQDIDRDLAIWRNAGS
jgi:DNA invertase Pin-like site-specific DNA recombinase